MVDQIKLNKAAKITFEPTKQDGAHGFKNNAVTIHIERTHDNLQYKLDAPEVKGNNVYTTYTDVLTALQKFVPTKNGQRLELNMPKSTNLKNAQKYHAEKDRYEPVAINDNITLKPSVTPSKPSAASVSTPPTNTNHQVTATPTVGTQTTNFPNTEPVAHLNTGINASSNATEQTGILTTTLNTETSPLKLDLHWELEDQSLPIAPKLGAVAKIESGLSAKFDKAANGPIPPPKNVTSINSFKQEAIEQATKISELADEVKEARFAARTMKLGKLGVVTSAAVTVGVAGLLKYSFSLQRDLADQLLDGKAHEDYIKLNQEIETMMLVENFGAQGFAFLLTTPALEAVVREKFKNFSDKYLSPEQHDMLRMSMFDGISSQEKFAKEIMHSLPENHANCPTELQELWNAREAIISLKMPTRGSKDVWKSQMELAKEEYNAEFKNVMKDPAAAKKLISGVPDELKVEIIAITARSDDTNQHPEIQLLADLQEQLSNTAGTKVNAERRADLRQAIFDTKESLVSQKDVLNQYVNEYFDTKNALTDKQNMQIAQATSSIDNLSPGQH